ncbi:hypothetical protein [Frigoribacterium sp. PvP054]|uniref:hypothetical protein n=1 Tax=Frigoribacterium sp. PvP054 TaxID=3156438 RepID=UPI0033955F21
MVQSELTSILRPNDPPDLRLKRLVLILSTVKRPESIYTWLRANHGASAELLRQIGNREIALSHESFDKLPKTASVEHIRAILVHNKMLPAQDDRQLAMFTQWLDERLLTLSATPAIHSPIERFARWHHLPRLREKSTETKNMNYAVRNAKQEITEAGKFLQWLLDERMTTATHLGQIHLDEYISEGPSTRQHIRNFVRYLQREETLTRVDVARREAKTTPMLTQSERLNHVRRLMEAENMSDSIRVAGLIFLLYGIPIGRISMMKVDQVSVRPTGLTIRLGKEFAPVPEALIPLFLDHLGSRDMGGTVNTGTDWLFPGARAGKPRSPNTLLLKLRDDLGIDLRGVRNTTLRGLVEEIDPSSLAKMLGYSKQTMSKHASAATVPWSRYVTDKNPNYASPRPTRPPAAP